MPTCLRVSRGVGDCTVGLELESIRWDCDGVAWKK